MNTTESYICDACGEEIVVPIDISAGHSQQYFEDGPGCLKWLMPICELNTPSPGERAW